jgi:type IV pilus assembly protein PilO
MADTPRSTPILVLLLAAAAGYMGWSGDGIELAGVEGVRARQERVVAMQDTLSGLRAQIDTAKADLARESVEDVQARVAAYQGSLDILRTLVPEQREVADLLDDIQIRAKVRGVRFANFDPKAPVAGPAPFDTYGYDLAVIGKYHEVGAFLADIASMRRIIVPGEVTIKAADIQQARVLGDTTGMLEARFSVTTYVKGTMEDTNVP